jgi:hypothetical protein
MTGIERCMDEREIELGAAAAAAAALASPPLGVAIAAGLALRSPRVRGALREGTVRALAGVMDAVDGVSAARGHASDGSREAPAPGTRTAPQAPFGSGV